MSPMIDETVGKHGTVGITSPSGTAAVLKVLMFIRSRSAEFVTPRRMSECPKCGCGDLRRSQVRAYERLRKALTSNRPYRCASCQARVWGDVKVESPIATLGSDAWTQTMLAQEPDLTAVDRYLGEA
jgi:hypothetical protein